MIPLSKVMDMPLDAGRFSSFVQDLLAPDRYPDLLAGQHEARAWEYGMALEAITRWAGGNMGPTMPLEILDAGSASSNLWKALTAFTSEPITRVDPLFAAPETWVTEGGQYSNIRADLSYFAETLLRTKGQRITFKPYDVITAISVIEHIHDHQESPDHPSPLQAFLHAAHDLLRPGGLLILTTDYWERLDRADTAHFHWMRERIYNPPLLVDLITRLGRIGFQSCGEADFSWHGAQVYDYAMASIVMVKKEN